MAITLDQIKEEAQRLWEQGIENHADVQYARCEIVKLRDALLRELELTTAKYYDEIQTITGMKSAINLESLRAEQAKIEAEVADIITEFDKREAEYSKATRDDLAGEIADLKAAIKQETKDPGSINREELFENIPILKDIMLAELREQGVDASNLNKIKLEKYLEVGMNNLDSLGKTSLAMKEVTATINKGIESAKELASDIGKGISEDLAEAKLKIAEAFTKAGEEGTKAARGMSKAIGSFFRGVKEELKEIGSAIKDGAGFVGEKAVAGAKAVGRGTVAVGAAALGGAVMAGQAVGKGIDAVGRGIDAANGAIDRAEDKAINVVKGSAKSAWDRIKKAAHEVMIAPNRAERTYNNQMAKYYNERADKYQQKIDKLLAKRTRTVQLKKSIQNTFAKALGLPPISSDINPHDVKCMLIDAKIKELELARVNCLRERNCFQEAALDESIKIDPKNTALYNQQKTEIFRNTQAIDSYSNAIRTMPENDLASNLEDMEISSIVPELPYLTMSINGKMMETYEIEVNPASYEKANCRDIGDALVKYPNRNAIVVFGDTIVTNDPKLANDLAHFLTDKGLDGKISHNVEITAADRHVTVDVRHFSGAPSQGDDGTQGGASGAKSAKSKDDGPSL